MGCQDGKGKAKPKQGDFECKKCGAVHSKKAKLCKPKKIKSEKG